MKAIIGHKSAFGCAQNLQFRSLERCRTGLYCSRKPTDTHHQVSNPSKISSAANTANSWPTQVSQCILFHQRLIIDLDVLNWLASARVGRKARGTRFSRAGQAP